MNTKSSRPDYGDLHRLWEDVIRLRLRVSSLEEAQIKKRLGGHCGLHLPASLKRTRMDAARETQALHEMLVRDRILLREFPRGGDRQES